MIQAWGGSCPAGRGPLTVPDRPHPAHLTATIEPTVPR